MNKIKVIIANQKYSKKVNTLLTVNTLLNTENFEIVRKIIIKIDIHKTELHFFNFGF